MFIAIFLSIALFVCLDGYQTSRSDRTGSITSLQSGWGSWGQTRYCNDGEYAIGIKLKVEGSQGSGDDTSANSLGLLCGIYGTATLTETIYPSNGQQWGSWSEDVLCPTNHILGFKSKVESSQGGGDDTALNSIQIKCEDGSYNQPSNGGGWGNWGSLDECPSGSVVCGFRIKVESSQSGGDDTALNAIDLQCCSPTISYSEIKSSNGLCLDVHASCLYNNGCKVQLWSCNGEIQQQWYYNSITKTIKNKGGLCLDVHLPDLNNNGAKIQVYTCNNQNNQKFNINNDPINTQYKEITNYVGKCLDVHAVDHLSQINGGKVQTYSCGAPSQSSTNQLWTLSQLTTTKQPTVQPTSAPTQRQFTLAPSCSNFASTDIVFLVDASCSISSQQCSEQQQFIAELAVSIKGNNHNHNMDNIRLSYITFGGIGYYDILIPLNDVNYNSLSIYNSIPNINNMYNLIKHRSCDVSGPVDSGYTDLEGALNEAYNQFDLDPSSDSNQRDKKIIIFSNCDNNIDETEICIDYENEHGVNIIMVNLGDLILNPLQYIMCLVNNDINKIFAVNDITYNPTLENLIPSIAAEICNKPTPAPTQDPTFIR